MVFTLLCELTFCFSHEYTFHAFLNNFSPLNFMKLQYHFIFMIILFLFYNEIILL